MFHVTLGAYDGAEVCELVGTYMLIFISKKYDKKDIRFSHNDGLGAIKNKSEQNTLNTLNTFIQCNIKIVNNLDV